MPKIASWRGCPTSTSREDALKIFSLAKLSKRDTFYDLGCGHGNVCLWAAPYCKEAKGIEILKLIVKRARRNVAEAGVGNVEILHGNIFDHPLEDATVLFCIIELKLEDFEKWSTERRNGGMRIVTLGPPPVPIMPQATEGNYCLTRFPYEKARTPGEWFRSVLNPNQPPFWKSVKLKYDDMTGLALRIKRREFKEAFP